MSDHKRKASTTSASSENDMSGFVSTQSSTAALIKRPKTNGNDIQALTRTSGSGSQGSNTLVRQGPKRTSGLQAPIMQLSGHEGDVTTCRFSPSGEHIASGSSDRQIFLWNTYGDCTNYGILKGHKGGILEIQWMPDGKHLIAASADNTVSFWDATTGERLKRGKGHSSIVNACCPLSKGTGDINTFVSASDDGTSLIWDIRQKRPAAIIDHNLPLTSIATSLSGDTVFTGSIDNNITAWDLRTLNVTNVLRGHTDSIMGISVSQKTGNYLLSTSLDSTVRLWDLRPYCRNPNRCERVFTGAPHGFEKNLIKPAFDKDESLVASGSADRTLTIWNARSGEIKYKLPGHKGCVNQVDFHPKEPITLSGSVDKTMFVGEI